MEENQATPIVTPSEGVVGDYNTNDVASGAPVSGGEPAKQKMPTGAVVTIAVLAVALCGALGFIVGDKLLGEQAAPAPDNGSAGSNSQDIDSEEDKDGSKPSQGNGQAASTEGNKEEDKGSTNINLGTAKPVSNPDGNRYEIHDTTGYGEYIKLTGDNEYKLDIQGGLAGVYNKESIRGTFTVTNAKRILIGTFGQAAGDECILVIYNDGTVGYAKLEEFVESGKIKISRISGISKVVEIYDATASDDGGSGHTMVAMRSDNTFYDLRSYIWE